MFLSIPTKRGYRAINVTEIVQMDFRRGASDEESSLELTFRTAIEEDEDRVLRVKGVPAARIWRLLESRDLLLTAESEPVAATV